MIERIFRILHVSRSLPDRLFSMNVFSYRLIYRHNLEGRRCGAGRAVQVLPRDKLKFLNGDLEHYVTESDSDRAPVLFSACLRVHPDGDI